MHLPSLLPALRRPDRIHRFDCLLLRVMSLVCITLLIGGSSTGAATGVADGSGTPTPADSAARRPARLPVPRDDQRRSRHLGSAPRQQLVRGSEHPQAPSEREHIQVYIALPVCLSACP